MATESEYGRRARNGPGTGSMPDGATAAEDRRVVLAAEVGEIMERNVVVAALGDTLLDAARRMRDHRVSGLPVVDSSLRVVGVVSERDIDRELHRTAGLLTFRGVLDLVLALEGSAEPDRIRQAVGHLRHVRVKEAMTSHPVTIDPRDTLGGALRLLDLHSVARLPVTENGRLVGIVTRSDIVHSLAQASDGPRRADGPGSLRTLISVGKIRSASRGRTPRHRAPDRVAAVGGPS
ncbi:MAG TPA: CBS domain-containing protein [Thermoplasmata archaeon]|nr:CBS domain-containing protein [Thermoplasmata archaeon]